MINNGINDVTFVWAGVPSWYAGEFSWEDCRVCLPGAPLTCAVAKCSQRGSMVTVTQRVKSACRLGVEPVRFQVSPACTFRRLRSIGWRSTQKNQCACRRRCCLTADHWSKLTSWTTSRQCSAAATPRGRRNALTRWPSRSLISPGWIRVGIGCGSISLHRTPPRPRWSRRSGRCTMRVPRIV
eukprot:SAG11_NODE_1898_length_4091_cov_9.766283_3_plen_183_part_00